MRHCNRGVQARQMTWVRQQFAQGEGLPFSDVLSALLVAQALHAAEVKDHDQVYSATVLLWAFLSQVMDADQSCQAAVMRVIAHRLSQGEEACSSSTGAYCQARGRMPEVVFAECVRQTAQTQEAQAPEEWRWKGRIVKIADGTTCSMPDTPDNQEAYPQPTSQEPGLGFPLMRVLAVFSLATGLVQDLRFCRFAGKHQSELGLLRQLWDLFAAGEIVLGDRYFCSWCEIALLQQRGVDVVMRLHQARNIDFAAGQRVAPGDHLLEWTKPDHRPDWMDRETYEALPLKLVMRVIRVTIKQRGFRAQEIMVATTLLDAQEYPAEDVAELYWARWHAEIDLRSLKETMQMDVLRGQSPGMVRKEIWVHALAYNLIRTVIAQAAVTHEVLPRTISFKGALQAVKAFQPQLAEVAPEDLPRLCAALWEAIVLQRIGNRSGRIEPRAVKRRPKPYKLLTQPRAQARMALCHKQ